MMTLSNKRKYRYREMSWMFLCKLDSEEKDRVFARDYCNYGDCEEYNKLGEFNDFH